MNTIFQSVHFEPKDLFLSADDNQQVIQVEVQLHLIIGGYFCLNNQNWQVGQPLNFSNKNSSHFLLFSLLHFLSTWRKYLPKVIAAVRVHVRALSWYSQAAHPHFSKIVPSFKAA